MQLHLNKADSELLTATNEVFTANGNERVALENLAAVAERSPADLLDCLE
jgi:hypothetical protein